MSQGGCLIGLDIGSSEVKGVLLAASGRLLAGVSRHNRLLAPRDGWVELDPAGHLENVCGILRELAAAAPEKVMAVAMAAASGNTLLTTEAGEPLGNIISWMDRRASERIPAALSGLEAEDVRRIAGWPCVGSFPLAHLAWLRENRPDSLRRAGHVGMDTDWLAYQLTGIWRMDHSTATTFHLQDQVTGGYYQPFLDRLGIERQRLSELIAPGQAVGTLRPEMAVRTGLPETTLLAAGCFDHPAAARAAGVIEPGMLMLSCGTSWVGFVPCGKRETVLKARMLCEPFLSGSGGPWGGMFSVPHIGRAITWYVDNVIAPREAPERRVRVFDEMAGRSRPGANGVKIDLRQKPQAPDADPADVSRAVMESAARLIADKLAEASSAGLSYRRAVMVGGPSRSPVWPAIVADITGLEVEVGGRGAGARGAAMLAGIGAGFYGDEQDALAVWGRGRGFDG
ncbi:MAG: FGGY family carbohydrate kinase [Kiritimatiellae bacterium]|nr:FGGY family carbohydrate kinase [Kiritimatiellia bacterium]